MTGGRTVTGRNVFTGAGQSLALAGGVIASMTPADCAADVYIAPGLVDLQVNGFRGVDLNAPDVTPADVARLVHEMRSTGVTTFLPTLITTSGQRLLAALRAIAAARNADPEAARAMPFVHVEGPWISPEDGPRGAHPAEHVRAPDLAEFARWQAASGGIVGMVTLSPHWSNAPEVIAALSAAGVRIAIGHTHAGPQAITDAVDAGARLSTHLGNGIAAMLPRHPNAIWTQLAEDRLTKTFIADGHHLPGDVFKAMLRAAGQERALLVSDLVALAGMAPGIYDTPVGGRVELGANGRLGVFGTPYLAGAATPLIDTLPRAMAMAGLSLAEAFGLAARAPGAIIGGRGLLEVGAAADLIRFRWTPGMERLELLETIISLQVA